MSIPDKVRPLVSDLGIFGRIDDRTCLVIPKSAILIQETRKMEHKKTGTYTALLILISRKSMQKSLNQHKFSYKTHKYSFDSSQRVPKYPRYTKKAIMCPWNHLTHIQLNSKGVLLGMCYKD